MHGAHEVWPPLATAAPYSPWFKIIGAMHIIDVDIQPLGKWKKNFFVISYSLKGCLHGPAFWDEIRGGIILMNFQQDYIISY